MVSISLATGDTMEESPNLGEADMLMEAFRAMLSEVDPSSTTLTDKVKSHLDSRSWRYETIPERSLITAGAKGRAGSFKVIFDMKEDRELLLIYVMCQMNFPEECRERLAVYLTLCNYSMTLGNFEMDMSDGEVRYKMSATTKGSEMTLAMIEEMLDVSLAMADRFFEGMVKVAYAGLEPKAAYDLARGNLESSSTSNDSCQVVEARAQ